MTLLEDLATYFTTQGLVTGDGVDVFRDFMPETPDNIVSLHEYQGDAISPYTAAVHRSVQVTVRNSSAAAAQYLAKSLCQALRNDLDDAKRVNFTGSRWGQVHIRQSPYKLKQDENDRTLYGFNLGITTTIE